MCNLQRLLINDVQCSLGSMLWMNLMVEFCSYWEEPQQGGAEGAIAPSPG